MTVKYYAILTNQGAARLANATMLGSKLNLTQMAVGDANGVLPTPDPAQTKLINQKRIAPLNLLSVDPNNQSQIIAEQIIPENEGGFWIREIGLYDDEGVLIAVANCPETYKPQLQEGSGRTQTIRMILVVTNTEAITLKIDPSVVLATRKYVDDEVLELRLYVDDQMRNHIAAQDPHTQYAQKHNPTFTGEPKAPTPAAGNNTTRIATTEFVQAAITALINGAPATLDTLKEIAAAINNDPKFSTTINNALSGKQPLDETLTHLSGKDVAGLLAYLGLPELLNLKRDKTDNRFSTFVFESGRPEDSLWLAYDEQKKQFAIAVKVDGAAKYVYLQNKEGNLALEEQVTALLNLKRDKTDNRFSTFVFESGRPEDSLWLAYDEQKKQFAIAFKVDGAAKYVYLQNKGGSLALEEQVTAQAILTKLLQVDGSGSGLDADLVRGLPADFGSSPSTNGYQKLPSGMIIQWGLSEITPTDVYVKFPVAFTRPPLFIGESSPGGGHTTSVWTANSVTNVGFNATQICVLSNTSDRVLLPGNNATTWLAIGF